MTLKYELTYGGQEAAEMVESRFKEKVSLRLDQVQDRPSPSPPSRAREAPSDCWAQHAPPATS